MRHPLALLLLGSLACAPLLPAADTAATLRQIGVSGSAEVKAPPTRAEWTLSISVQHKQLTEARSQVRSAAAKLLARLQAAGIPAADIQRGTGSQQVAWDHSGMSSSGKARREGFVYAMDVRIVLRDLSRLDAIEDLLAGDDSISAPPALLTRDDLPALRAQARTLAIQAARAKAEAMAKDAGAGLGQILALDETETAMPMSFNRAVNGIMAMSAAAPESAPLPEPGTLTISAQINARYALE